MKTKYLFLIAFIIHAFSYMEAQKVELEKKLFNDFSELQTEFTCYSDTLNNIFEKEYVMTYLYSHGNKETYTIAFGDFKTNPKAVIFSSSDETFTVYPVSKNFISGIESLYKKVYKKYLCELPNYTLIYEPINMEYDKEHGLFTYMIINNLQEGKSYSFVRMGYYGMCDKKNALEILSIAISNCGLILKDDNKR